MIQSNKRIQQYLEIQTLLVKHFQVKLRILIRLLDLLKLIQHLNQGQAIELILIENLH